VTGPGREAGGRVVCCSVTAAGDSVASRLPYERHRSDITGTVARLWGQVDGFVLVCATGIAVRAIAPHLGSKKSDPAVVCVDDRARFVVALAGGHERGANRMAREVAGLTGATPVITTASDTRGIPSLGSLPGFGCAGEVAAVTRAWLDGWPPAVRLDPGLEDWPLPRGLPDPSDEPGATAGVGGTRITVTDRERPPEREEILLRPRSLVLGVGASSAADPASLARLVESLLEDSGLSRTCISTVATIDRKLAEPAIVELAEDLGVPLAGFAPGELSGVRVPNPSRVVNDAVGTASVSEAAALLAAGPGASLVRHKSTSAARDSTVAIARRRSPAGHLAVVGLGPGEPAKRTVEAVSAIRAADVVVGFSGYVELAADLLEAHQEVHRSPIGSEVDRCRFALSRAARGSRVALVCSGDPGVYAMASLVIELAGASGWPPVTVVPGVTAALAAAAVLGAPLGHDHAAVSLSDLLTPWDVIERRLKAVADGDFVVSLYNPRSRRRARQLARALAILAGARSPETPAAIVSEAGRQGQQVVRATLAELDVEQVGMLSVVVVGSTQTRWAGGRMVTPRGYEPAG
jgi:cobalt-precorrin 5A hydrolase/precorrin-3B C17-methyltransferase